MSNKVSMKKWDDKRVQDILTRIQNSRRYGDVNEVPSTAEELVNIVSDMDPSPNGRFFNILMTAINKHPHFYLENFGQKDRKAVRDGLNMYLDVIKEIKEKWPGEIDVKLPSNFSQRTHVIQNIIDYAHETQRTLFYLEANSDSISEMLIKFPNRKEMLAKIKSSLGDGQDINELLDPEYSYWRSHLAHPRIRDLIKDMISQPTLPSKEKFMGGARPHIVSEEQSEFIEECRHRDDTLNRLFKERHRGVLIDYPWNPDINVYTIFDISYNSTEILLTKEVDGIETPVANTFAVERYVVPEFRGQGLGIELVLIPNRVPGINKNMNGTGCYSPGGFKTREKAYDILLAEQELKLDNVSECAHNEPDNKKGSPGNVKKTGRTPSP